MSDLDYLENKVRNLPQMLPKAAHNKPVMATVINREKESRRVKDSYLRDENSPT